MTPNEARATRSETANETLAEPASVSDLFQGNIPILEALAKLRLRLLDLTGRNRLLNFKHAPGKSIQFVHSSIKGVFSQLTDNAMTKVAVTPVPEPPRNKWVREAGRLARPDVKQYAAEIGLSTSHELTDGAGLEGGAVRALYYPDELARHCRKLAREARSAIEETGANMLFLVFGFLEYPERPDSERVFLAPLVCVPVALEKDRVDSVTGQDLYALKYTGEDLADNLSLREKLKREYAFELPEFDEEAGPEAYIRQIKALVRSKPGWSVKRQMTLTLLSFSKMLLVRELDPATWPAAPDGQSILLAHNIVRMVFEGAPNEVGSVTPQGEDYDVDKHPASPLPLIYDADTSQLSALIDALDGKNLVIEGPPGTGKSQTITNLIAAAIARGKTVLFVAEKLAALQVVKKRLAAAHLEHFCLELHSNKTQKKVLLEEIRKRRDATFAIPRELASSLLTLEAKRQQLAGYADLMNSQLGNACGMTVHELLWRAECERQATGEEWPAVQGVRVKDAGGLSRSDYEGLYDFLAHVGEQFTRLNGFGAEHPFWGFYCDDLRHGVDRQLETLLKSFLPAFDTLDKLFEQASQLLGGAGVPTGLAEVTALKPMLEGLAPPGREHMDHDALPRLFSSGDPQGRQAHVALTRLKDRLVRIAKLKSDIGERIAPAVKLTDPDSKKATQLLAALESLGLANLTTQQLQEFSKSLVGLMSAAATALARLPAMGKAADVPFGGEFIDLKRLIALTQGAASAPRELLPYRYAALGLPDTVATLQRARGEHVALREENGHLAQLFYLDSLESQSAQDKLTECISVLRQGHQWYRVLQSSWRRACAFHRGLERAKHKKHSTQRLQEMERIAAFIKDARAWRESADYAQALGPFLKHGVPDFSNALRLAQWHHDTRKRLVDAGLDPSTGGVLGGDEVRLSRLAGLHQEVTGAESALRGLQQFLHEHFSASPVGHDLVTCVNWPRIATWAHKVEEQLQMAASSLKVWVLPNVAIVDAVRAVHANLELPKVLAELEADEEARSLVGNRYQGVETNLEGIANAFAYGLRVHAAHLPPPIAGALLHQDATPNHEALCFGLVEILKGWERISEFEQRMSALARFGIEDWACEKRANQAFMASLSARTQAALAQFDRLLPWSQYLQVAKQARARGLEDFINVLETKEVAPQHLARAFGYRFFGSIAENLFDIEPQLACFAGASHEQVRGEFARLDKNVISVRGRESGVKASRAFTPPAGSRGVRVDDKTEMELINHMVAHPLARVTLRRMMQRAGRAVQVLKPCFMMGPQAVAQYLKPGALHFDLIIMDEASQLRPEEALGSIARGRQLVVVGDPKQLPPTSFFDRLGQTSDEGPETQTATDDAESILDVCMGHFRPVRTLKWHYRSQHESLIAFSNSRFYDSRLIVFPSPFGLSDRLGLRYHYVADAIYEHQTNKVEAARVVDAAIEHMLTHPEESLGIVTLNLRQRDYIEELLEARCRNHPATEEYRARWEAEGLGLFVKNLESVQGDEREVMFISTTFGRAPGTTVVRQNFGPISRQTGWRRLNVLFTRARKSVHVFSSMRPEDVVVDAGTPAGTKSLREYLVYAQTGRLVGLPEAGAGEPENPFEEAVTNVLKHAGHEVVGQLGVAGFRIDIAVKHPDYPSAYLAAIECDGASYHTGVAVRDRDRIRQEILESLGWKGRIWRIWSTDWFRSPRSETQRMLEFLKSVRGLAVPAAYVQEAAEVEEEPQIPTREMRAAPEARRPPEPTRELFEEPFELVAPARVRPPQPPRPVEPAQEDEGEVIALDEEEELEVQVGDTVTYTHSGRTDEPMTVQIVAGPSDAANGLINEGLPLAKTLLSAMVGDEVVLRVPGRDPQRFVVRKIARLPL